MELKFPWKYVYRVRSTCTYTYFVVSEPRREGGNFFIFQIWRIYLKMGKKINKKLHISNIILRIRVGSHNALFSFSVLLFLIVYCISTHSCFIITCYICWCLLSSPRFWLGPIVSLCAAFAIDKWIRAKTVHSVELFIELLSHSFFLVSI